MKLELLTPLEDLNSSNHNKVVVCQGNVSELSSEFEDKDYGFIQMALIQSFREDNQKLGVQREENVILQEDFVGLISLGDKVRITGVLSVYNVDKSTISNHVIFANKIEVLNDELDFNLTEQDITKFKTIAKQPLIQQKLANYIFDKLPIEDNIKLIGTLILFCAESPKLVERGIHCYISLLVVGASGTYKSTYLHRIREILPNLAFQFSQKSDGKFITYKSQYKKGNQFCKKAGLADFAKKGMILIDNMEELKPYRLMNLDKNFIQIMRKSSIISAVHTKHRRYYDKMSVYENLQFLRKNNLLGKFDIVLVASIRPDYQISNYETYNVLKKEKIDNDLLLSKTLLRKYINYAKKEYEPVFTEEAINYVNKFKEAMLRINKEKKKKRKINQQKLIRVLTMLCKAYARIALRNEINAIDVQTIIRIYKNSLSNLDLI